MLLFIQLQWEKDIRNQVLIACKSSGFFTTDVLWTFISSDFAYKIQNEPKMSTIL